MELVNETAIEALANQYLDYAAGGSTGKHYDEAILYVVASAPSSEGPHSKIAAPVLITKML